MLIRIYVLSYLFFGLGFTSLHASSNSSPIGEDNSADPAISKGLQASKSILSSHSLSPSSSFTGPESPSYFSPPTPGETRLEEIKTSPSPSARSSYSSSPSSSYTGSPHSSFTFSPPTFLKLPPSSKASPIKFSPSPSEEIGASYVPHNPWPKVADNGASQEKSSFQQSPISISVEISASLLSNDITSTGSSNSHFTTSSSLNSTHNRVSPGTKLETIPEHPSQEEEQPVVVLDEKKLKKARYAAVDLFQPIITSSEESCTLKKIQDEIVNLLNCWYKIKPFEFNDSYNKSLKKLQIIIDELGKDEDFTIYKTAILDPKNLHKTKSVKHYLTLRQLLKRLKEKPDNIELLNQLSKTIIKMEARINDSYVKKQYGEGDGKNICNDCKKRYSTLSRVGGQYVLACPSCGEEEILE